MVNYPIEKIKGLKKIISNSRKNILNEFGALDHDKHIFAGDRFNDDEEIVYRLNIFSNQNTIRYIGWEQAIRVALIDCMYSDYQYKFKK